MPVTDPIADLLTRIRNAVKANKRRLDVPYSKIKREILQILKDQNFITDFAETTQEGKSNLRIQLKYTNGTPAITGLERISTPGLRKYAPADELPRVLNGYGIAIISTSKGILTDKQARRDSVGGEILCHIW